MDQLSKYPHLNRYVSNLRSIPGGQFHWGASPSKEELGTPITMSPFRMGATPVTVAVWKEYCAATNIPMPNEPHWGWLDDHPVVNVSWEDIEYPGDFCEWASGVAGFRLTLPTDAQWEYAARGGVDGLEYPWGNDFDETKLWCDADKTASVDRTDRIYRNGYGLTDMVGNVYEWCADLFSFDYRPDGKDPVDTEESDYRCVRGSMWFFSVPDFFRCAYRRRRSPEGRDLNLGFRLSAGPG